MSLELSSLAYDRDRDREREDEGSVSPNGAGVEAVEFAERGRSTMLSLPSDTRHTRSSSASASYSPSRPPTSAEIDAVIAAAIANAPPPPPPQPEYSSDNMTRSVTPLMTNLLPSAVGLDGRVNLFVGNLPYRVRWQDLKDLFRKAGTVLRADVSLGPDNRSRGYGTVLMGSREDAARAIDRYNGYNWQTRTLEVRPDRLPPEYEVQAHNQHHNAASRNSLYPYHNHSSAGAVGHPPFPGSGHLTPNGAPGWMPGQHQRSPFGLPPVPNSHMLGVPGMGVSPGAPPMSINGSSPIPSSQSPAAIYGTLPLSVQNTGGQPYPQLAASPLAGSLTAGTTTGSAQNISRDSLTPFSNSISPDMIPRSTSPGTGGQSRPSSSGKLPSNGSPTKESQGNRAPPPGTLGNLPPSLFANANSPSETAPAPNEVAGVTPPGGKSQSGAPIPALEGLSHHGMGLGPPNTLHDRVLFISNLPLSMQWQDLKDLLRPAGTIIRADVATDGHGRPRGFGTALFATETDATRAVNMFNDRDIGGNRIRAHLERDSLPERVQRSHSLSESQNGVHSGYQSPPDPTQSNGSSQQDEFGSEKPLVPPIDTSTPIQSSRTSIAASADTSPVAKLPWSLNTSLQSHQTPGRPNFRQNHHPGPISMPSFSNMDSGNPLSPQGRGLPPMTPSMPGFVFNAYPETPPVHPHFMSPGIGPFSPGIPVTSPTGFQYNPFLNAAPGAPVNRYPQVGGSAQLGTPTTQAFPNGNGPGGGMIHQYAGPPGPPNISQTLDYFPNMLHQQQYQSLSQGAPDSPTPRVPSRPPPSASPLNAKDRLAPAPDSLSTGMGEVDLSALTSALTIKDGPTQGLEQDSPSKPAKSPRGIDLGFRDFSIDGGSSKGKGLGVPNTMMNGGGRASLDESRTSFGLDLEDDYEVERRASFGAAPGSGR